MKARWSSRERGVSTLATATATATDVDFLIGLDLGQSSDPSALAVLKRSLLARDDDTPVKDRDGNPIHKYDCNHLHRWPPGTSYPAIVRDVAKLAARPELRGMLDGRSGPPRLVVDATGVGRAVCDLFFQTDMAGARVEPVTITAGDGSRF